MTLTLHLRQMQFFHLPVTAILVAVLCSKLCFWSQTAVGDPIREDSSVLLSQHSASSAYLAVQW